MTHDLTWGWFFACLLALALQTGVLVLAAPWFSGWVNRLTGRLTGERRFPAGGRWQDSHHQFRRQGLRLRGDGLSGLACRGALILAVFAACMTPVFTLVPAGFPAPGFFLLCAALVGASLLLGLPLVVQGGTATLAGYTALLADALLLPALVPVLVMAGGQDFSVFLAHLRLLSPAGEGAPFVLMGVALFLVTAWKGRLAGEDLQGQLSGADRALWMLAADCVQLVWITLAGDVAWAGSLALPGDGGAEPWLAQCLAGGAFWVAKLSVAALLLAGTHLMVLTYQRRARVRLAAVFLLGLLAWQVAYAGQSGPQTGNKTASMQDEQESAWRDDGATP
ncbi:hypothetical protein [Acetobacter orleanensis]|uniref:Uncharacterized protein n=1 Tax=Acetobacter orleanensis TaxID=104099 RepID=A0A4Y3TJW6_9PROT|nr:hypothetical protein [Acetobacter orleanensis]KXV62840.1 hypothetical protein AD949_08760 [Acetobacter orleanensis]PCD80615.1 hypothetical protein CO710_02490 [Acetobacter orleanensis]GAN68053.1 hypothetical protein Abol_014_104 [Acetobacter orleanensis JCM 7639]GBR27209.1 hypothetical protein AA0473_1369 [Acetobacter orleanensis NRIC 0473]GEB82024.1 hypothetical protein AOR01nite_05010 [Acetobacter orleanensis]